MAELKFPQNLKKGRVPNKEARLREFSSGWVIEFFYLDKETGKLVRHRLKRNKRRDEFGDDRHARVAIAKECKEINRMLANGWTPKGALIEDAPKEDSIKYLLNLFLEERDAVLRVDTMRSYRSIIKRFLRWMKEQRLELVSVYDFTPEMVLKFSDMLKRTVALKGKSYNNNVAVLSAAWAWMIDERFIEVPNLFKRLKKMREETEPRAIVPEEYDKTIFEYCAQHEPVLQLIIQLIYAPSFMRITELGKTKLKYIDFKEKVISLPAHSEKTHKYKTVLLSDTTIKMMIDLGVHKLDQDDFLFGKERGYFGLLKIGSQKPLGTRQIDKNWEKLRNVTGLPKSYQLYSYRHRGVSSLYENGVPIERIKLLTGHSSEVIMKYVTIATRNKAAKSVAKLVRPLQFDYEDVKNAKIIRPEDFK